MKTIFEIIVTISELIFAGWAARDNMDIMRENVAKEVNDALV